MATDHTVYVGATYLGAMDVNNSSLSPSNSSFCFVLQIMSCCRSDNTTTMNRRWNSCNAVAVREIKNFSLQRNFIFPCQSLISDNGTITTSSWDIVSGMISDMNIPFALDKLQWRGSPIENWTPINNHDDVVRQILDFVCRKGSLVSNADPKELKFLLDIKKEITLPHLEFEAMVNARRVEEQVQDLNAAISWMNEQQTRLNRPFLRNTWQSMIVQPARELGVVSSLESLIEQAIRESAEVAGCKPIAAAKSSTEALEDTVFDGDDSTSSCTICMENLIIGCTITCMPCSHKFHKTCIVTWLERSNMCPLCRYKLSAT